MLERLKTLKLSQILLVVFRRYIYQVIWIGQYGVTTEDCVKPKENFEYSIDILEPDKWLSVSESNPYMSKEDLDEFTKNNAICIVAKDNDKIIGSTWLVPGGQRFYYHELKRMIEIKENDYYGRQTFVAPGYRGKNIFPQMVSATVTNFARGNGKIWAYIYNWNTSSIKAVTRLGWKHEQNVGFAKLFGIKFCLYKGTDTQVGYVKDTEISPTGVIL